MRASRKDEAKETNGRANEKMDRLRTAETRSEERRATILDAALDVFTDYGFRRASLEDIAHRAGISRTGLYHHFSSKEQIFHAMVERCHELTHALAVAALNSDAPLEDRLLASMDAKLGFFFRKATSTRHGAQVLSMGYRMGNEITLHWTGRYLDIMTEAFEKAAAAGQIDPSRIGADARSAVGFMILSAEGQQGPANNQPAPERYTRRLRREIRITIQALGGTVRPGF